MSMCFGRTRVPCDTTYAPCVYVQLSTLVGVDNLRYSDVCQTVGFLGIALYVGVCCYHPMQVRAW